MYAEAQADDDAFVHAANDAALIFPACPLPVLSSSRSSNPPELETEAEVILTLFKLAARLAAVSLARYSSVINSNA
jgi:hypothetical protein